MKSTTTLFTYNKFNHCSALFAYIDICIKATATATTLAAAAAITATRRRSYTKEKKKQQCIKMR